MTIRLSAALAVLAAATCAIAQETHDFRLNVATWPFAQNANFPGNCSLGQTFQLLLPPPTAPLLYVCGFTHDWHQITGSGASLPTTANMFYGDNAGGALASTFAPAAVLLSSGSYTNPAWLASIVGAKVTGDGISSHFLNGIGTYTAPAGGGGGASSTSQLTDFTPSISTGTVTIQPGMIRFGNMPCTNFTSAATAAASVSAGSGVGKLYASSNCALVLQYPSSVTATWTLSGMTAAPVATPAVPSDGWYIADVTLSTSALTAVADKRSIAGKDAGVAGLGISLDCTLGPCLISVDSAVVPTLGGPNAYTGIQDNTAATVTKPSRTVSADPSGSCASTAQPNEVVLSGTSGNSFSCLPTTQPTCSAGCTWHAMGGGSGSSPLTTKGDIYTRSSSADARLAVGVTNGHVLTVNSAATNGVDWEAPTGSGSTSQYITTGGAEVLISPPQVIAQSSALPALALGACWAFEAFFVTRTNVAYDLKLWFGTVPGTTGSSILSSNINIASGGAQGLQVSTRGHICNDNGTQATQNAVWATNGGSVTLTPITGTAENTPWTQNTDGSVALKIGLEISGGSVFTKVLSFRVWLVQ